MAKSGTILFRGAVVAFGLFIALPLAAREVEVGDQVVLIHDIDLRQGDAVVDHAYAGSQHKVLEITKDRLRLQGRKSDGWLKREEVITSPESIPYFSERIKRDSKDWAALCARGRLLQNEGKEVQAIADFDAAIRLNPDDARSWQCRGIARLNQKMFDDAILDISEWQKLQPADGYAVSIRALARLAKAGLARTSITPSSIQFNISPPSDKTRPLAKVEADAMFADLAAAIVVAPTNAKHYYARAAVHFLQRDYDNAISDLSQCTKLDPKSEYFNFRGYAWAKKLEYKRALQDLDEALRLDPKNLDAYQGRGRVRLELGDLDGAIDDCTKVISNDHKNIDSLTYRSFAYLQQKKSRMAISDADRAIEIDKERASAWFIRGQARAQLGDYKRALSDLNEGIRLDPNNAPGLAIRGVLEADLEKHQEAIEDLRQSAKLDPENSSTLAELAFLLATFPAATPGDREEALLLARSACQRTDWKAEKCLQVLATVYAELGQFDKAADWQTAAVRLATDKDVKAKREQILTGFRAKKTCRESPFTIR